MLQPLSGSGPACRLSCGEAGQPRSILAADMHSVMILFTGTSLGWVVMHHLVWDKGDCSSDMFPLTCYPIVCC